MELERTTFGTITIDRKTYEHDVIIRLSGEVARRKKKLSKKYYGTSHVLSKDEAKFVFEDGCEQLVRCPVRSVRKRTGRSLGARGAQAARHSDPARPQRRCLDSAEPGRGQGNRNARDLSLP